MGKQTTAAVIAIMTIVFCALVGTVVVGIIRASGNGDRASELLFGAAAAPEATKTPIPTATAAKPNLSEVEVIGLVKQRETRFPTTGRATTWGKRDFDVCLQNYYLEDYPNVIARFSAGGQIEHFPRISWTATNNAGRWTVDLACESKSGAEVLGASWTVDDASLRVIPIGVQAD